MSRPVHNVYVIRHMYGKVEGEGFATLKDAEVRYAEYDNGPYATRLVDASFNRIKHYGNESPGLVEDMKAWWTGLSHPVHNFYVIRHMNWGYVIGEGFTTLADAERRFAQHDGGSFATRLVDASFNEIKHYGIRAGVAEEMKAWWMQKTCKGTKKTKPKPISITNIYGWVPKGFQRRDDHQLLDHCLRLHLPYPGGQSKTTILLQENLETIEVHSSWCASFGFGYGSAIDARTGNECARRILEALQRLLEYVNCICKKEFGHLELLYANDAPKKSISYHYDACTQVLRQQPCSRFVYHDFVACAAILDPFKAIAFPGRVLHERGIPCVVSFPGKYSTLWNQLVDGELGTRATLVKSSACVFLTSKETGLGEHAKNPFSPSEPCYCSALYGRRDAQRCGFKDEGEWRRNGCRPSWGCLWFQHWRHNVEKARSLGQELLVVYFAGETSQGKVAWDELPNKDLWDDRGLGGSQKGEVAFLDKMGWAYKEVDITYFQSP